MLLVGQLYGKSNNGFQKNVNVVDVVDNVVDVVDVVDKTGNVVNVSNENHALNVHDRRERLLVFSSAPKGELVRLKTDRLSALVRRTYPQES